MCSYVCCVCVCFRYGIYQIKYGQPLSDLAPDGSYLQNYDKIQQVRVCVCVCARACVCVCMQRSH